jgi:predicted DNA-binding transcriptional regulator AlpA
MSKTIEQWCDAHSLSRAFFYKLEKQGKAPKTFNVGRLRRVSDEADRDWVRELEAERDAAAA